MPTSRLPRAIVALAYAEAAQEYLRSLPPEHFMEATSQATQRKITLESLDLIHARRPDVQVFNELLVQYPRRGQKRPGQIVPDNLVVVCDQPIDAEGSFDTPLQPVGPFLVLEYVSKHNRRKDYEASFDKFERELKVPYYLLFYPEAQEATLYRLKGRRYVSVKPNDAGRYAIPELDLEVCLLDGWVRYWYQERLLPLPAQMQRELDEMRRQAERAEQRADHAEQRAGQAEQRAEQERQAREAAESQLAELRAQMARGRRNHS